MTDSTKDSTLQDSEPSASPPATGPMEHEDHPGNHLATSNSLPIQADPLLPRVPLSRTDWRYTLLLLLLCAGIYLPVMGSYGMFDPWETHYTEVARQFMVRNDWLSTFWHNGQGPEGYSETNFWTKPVGSFWMSGLSLKLFGYSAATTGEELAVGNPEWAVRLPFFLCGLFGIFFVYLMCARIFNRRTGLLAGAIMATAPMYFMITRQAMTDMPYVGLVSGGIALFILAVFGTKEELPRRELHLRGWHKIPASLLYLGLELRPAKNGVGKDWYLAWPHTASYYLFTVSFLLFMGLQLNAIIQALIRTPLFSVLGLRISLAIWMIPYLVALLLFVGLSLKTRTKNEVYLYTFYMAVGIAGLAKGLVAALQPGLIILVYLISSREWRVLSQVALGRGLLIACCTFMPWFHGMVVRYGNAFWNELFGTEQLRRLTIGEQAQAKGTFEYYFNQIGYGLFPWIAFLPVAILNIFRIKVNEKAPEDRVRLFVTVWLMTALALFTLTITKYHHYILPAIPPAAILVAIFLNDLIEGKVRSPIFALLVSASTLVIVAVDLVKEPAQWVWMYTYLYDSNWAQGVPGSAPILYYTIAFGLALLLLMVPRLRKTAIWATLLITVVGGGILLNWYIIKVAPHWSQKAAIATYYKLRKSPQEEIVAWQFNWRGETWYTAAEVVVSKSLENKAIIDYLNKRPNRRFFFITERSRFASLRNMLPTKRGKDSLTIVYNDNIHYILAAAYL